LFLLTGVKHNGFTLSFCMNFPRASGVLLHPTSLPGPYGIGDFGTEAYKFVDQLEQAGQSYWQILPLGPTGYGDSPYQCFSAFAGNPLLISPEKLFEDGLISKTDLANKPNFPISKVDFGSVTKWKTQLAQKAFQGFLKTGGEICEKYEAFCDEQRDWLDDYAMFRAIKISQVGRPWYEWPDRFKFRDEKTIRIAAEQLAQPIQAEKVSQFLFLRQWRELKTYANGRGIKVIGDIPIFVALDSADVWCHQDQFKLNTDGSPKVVAGVPPDYFSTTGQLWGNPIYDWDVMARDGFEWWINRFRATFSIVDIARVDHFRGFCAAWEVPGKEETAEHGSWVNVPGKQLFTTLNRELGELPVIAEDLGVVTPDVEDLRDGFGFPGMRILQYAFGGDAKNHDLPHNYVRNCVAYTGTHDNDTTVGWWSSKVGAGSTRDGESIDHEHEFCLKYLNTDGAEINWDLIRAIWASVADTAITPVQDLIGLGNEGRMNLPASNSGNWFWRLKDGDLTDEILSRLHDLTVTYGRK
jgi:4-alpha-glucanotransferase